MSLHVIVGRGGTAVATARRLAESGDRVRIVSRSGAGPEHPRVERVTLDALDTGRLTEVAQGAATVFNCAAAPYHTWPELLPPLFGSVLAAAERTGANYVMLGNLYGYGPVEGPLTEEHPLAATGPKGSTRARLWLEAKAAHDAGRVRATEVRAAQFLGAGAFSVFSFLVQPKVLAGRLALVPQSLDEPHAYTSIGDAADALVAAARSERAWGRAWHAPAVHHSVREVATRLAELAGAPAPRLEELTDRELTMLGLSDPFWNELWETMPMSHRPFLVDSSAMRDAFGLKPTPLDDVLSGALDAR